MPDAVDNAFYDTLGDAWYDGSSVAMAILRHEAVFKNAWLLGQIHAEFGAAPLTLLDIGCGGGFVSNFMAARSYYVTGLDQSKQSLRVAQRYDASGSARYLHGSAYNLPFEDGSFRVVCAMDVLEHLEDPARCIAEASRVLAPGGLLFFQTYNRTPLAYVLFVWAVNRTPGAARNTHVYRLFISPDRLREHCQAARLEVASLTGFKVAATRAALKTLWGHYDEIGNLKYQLTPSLAGGYMGIARKPA